MTDPKPNSRAFRRDRMLKAAEQLLEDIRDELDEICGDGSACGDECDECGRPVERETYCWECK